MKKIFNVLAIIVIGTFALTSCNKNDGYDDSWYQKEMARIDSTNKAQAPIIEEYANQNLGEDNILDTASGIRWIMLEEAPVNSFNYINSSGQLNGFLTNVTYTGLLVPSAEEFYNSEKETSFTSNSVIEAWRFAFYPKSVELNGQVRKIGGLTSHGLHKGSKIRIIAPSTLCYDNVPKKNEKGEVTIPANTPLDFTINVLDITP